VPIDMGSGATGRGRGGPQPLILRSRSAASRRAECRRPRRNAADGTGSASPVLQGRTTGQTAGSSSLFVGPSEFDNATAQASWWPASTAPYVTRPSTAVGSTGSATSSWSPPVPKPFARNSPTGCHSLMSSSVNSGSRRSDSGRPVTTGRTSARSSSKGSPSAAAAARRIDGRLGSF
jgi:hypothetical protein